MQYEPSILDKLQRELLEILSDIDAVCRKHGITPDSRYDALRHLRLDRPVYSLDTL